VLCEAQAEGLPPVVFAVDGVTEAIPVERRPVLPEEKDVAALAEQIIHLMRDEEAWQEASISGRRFVESYFDLHAQTRILEDKYEEVIARRHA
jgi:glycosyltransferase involved in cell wall biosynthesis